MAICGEHFGKRPRMDVIGPETWSTSLQQILQFFRLYGRSRVDHDACTFVPAPGGPIQCHGDGPVVHNFSPVRQRQRDAFSFATIQGLVSQSPERWNDVISMSGIISHPHRRAIEESTDAQARCTRRRTDSWILDTSNFADHNAKCLKSTKQDPLSSTQLHEMLQRILQLTMKSELIYKFAAIKPLPKDQIPDDHSITIPWRLDLSMRNFINCLPN